jgi:hypothetical protein
MFSDTFAAVKASTFRASRYGFTLPVKKATLLAE